MRLAHTIVPGMEAVLDKARNGIDKQQNKANVKYVQGYYDGACAMLVEFMNECFGEDNWALTIEDGRHVVVPL